MSTTPEHALKRADISALWFFIAAGVAFAGLITAKSIQRIVEVLPNKNVSVPAWFVDTMANAPIGPDGTDVAVQLDRAILLVPEVQQIVLWTIVIQEVLLILTVVVVTASLVWLTRNIMRGTFFSRTNTVLIAVAGGVGLVGYAAVPFFGNMAANGAFAVLSDYTFDNALITIDPFTFIVIAFFVALLGTIFSIGERMQRDTEGLI